jgi:flagellar basal-body rod modification protein FlgD
MAVSALGVSSTGTATTLQASGIGQEDFMKIMLTQLSYQDPLKPMDNQQFVAQLAQFTSLEQTRQVNDRLDSLLGIQGATQSVGLIGKTVEISSSSGASVGTVTTINFAQGQPQLTVQLANGQFLTQVSPSQISVVR